MDRRRRRTVHATAGIPATDGGRDRRSITRNVDVDVPQVDDGTAERPPVDAEDHTSVSRSDSGEGWSVPDANCR